MHQADSYLVSEVYFNVQKKDVVNVGLQTQDANKLQRLILSDSNDYLYSAIVTFMDALSGIENSYYSWSIVKLYYSIFYSLRSLLAVNGIALFYVGPTPYSLDLSPGAHACKEKDNTHKCVINIYKKRFPSSLFLSQEIDGQSPLEWFIAQRELVNYKNSRFKEPQLPSCLGFLKGSDARKALISYIQDDDNLYTFDIDHAMLCFPLKIISNACKSLYSKGEYFFSEDDSRYLKGKLKVRSSSLPQLTELFCL